MARAHSKREVLAAGVSLLAMAGTAWGSDAGLGPDSGATGGAAGAAASGGAGGVAATGGAAASGGSNGGAGGAVGSVNCFGTPCDTQAGGFCCADGFVSSSCAGGSGVAKCELPGGPPCAPAAITLRCDGPEDCPGMVCCGSYQECDPSAPGYGANKLYGEVSCRPAEDCVGRGTSVLCTSGTPDACPSGEVCFPSSPSLPGGACAPCRVAQGGGAFGVAPDGTPCDDHDAATTFDRCQNGSCVGIVAAAGGGGLPGAGGGKAKPQSMWTESGRDTGCACRAGLGSPTRLTGWAWLLGVLVMAARRGRSTSGCTTSRCLERRRAGLAEPLHSAAVATVDDPSGVDVDAAHFAHFTGARRVSLFPG